MILSFLTLSVGFSYVEFQGRHGPPGLAEIVPVAPKQSFRYRPPKAISWETIVSEVLAFL